MTDCKCGVWSSVAVLVSVGGAFYYPSLLLISPLTYSVWPPLLISTDLFSVTGVGAVCGGSWLGCGDCQPGEQYFSPGALAPNLHKAMQLLKSGTLVRWVLNENNCWRAAQADPVKALPEESWTKKCPPKLWTSSIDSWPDIRYWILFDLVHNYIFTNYNHESNNDFQQAIILILTSLCDVQSIP